MKKVTFNKITNFTGRNGYMKCGGVEVFPYSHEPVTMLSALTSKGEVGRCDIAIPNEDVVSVAKALFESQGGGHKMVTLVEVSRLIPKSWNTWFFSAIAANKPSFSWGNNNRSLVDAETFARHCEDTFENGGKEIAASKSAQDKFLNKIWALGQTYIDLEN